MKKYTVMFFDKNKKGDLVHIRSINCMGDRDFARSLCSGTKLPFSIIVGGDGYEDLQDKVKTLQKIFKNEKNLYF